MKILNVEIDNLSHLEVMELITKWIKTTSSCHTIATVNAEMVVAAQKNKLLLEAINSSDLKTPESTAIIFSGLILRNKFKERIPGIDLIWRLIDEGCRQNWKWFFLGGGPGIASKAADNLRKKYPSINIVGAEDGGEIDINNLQLRRDLVEKINKTKPDILIVSFGIPKQELFLKTFKSEIEAKVAIGAGGSLDFIAGKQKRAPKIFRIAGLEWLWRLIREPKRFKRIWTAVVIFPWLIVKKLLNVWK
jgi:N-acetylglucosaminyldiphosphoundecaprenol N-acetyl-beta-D-mannosaminyltransferase